MKTNRETWEVKLSDRQSRFLRVLVPTLAVSVFTAFLSMFLADVFLTRALADRRIGDYQAAERELFWATRLNPFEPLYHREYAALLADLSIKSLAVKEDPEMIKQSQTLARNAGREAGRAIELNPRNSLTLKALLKTYYSLSLYYPAFEEITKSLGQTLLVLSPTEAHVRYSTALVFAGYGKGDQAIKLVDEALRLKPDYPEALSLKETLTKK
ncbi:MAG: hypothetical protein AAB486_00310 [Patescibacteria group bacterium]